MLYPLSNQYHALSPVKLCPDNTPCICAGLLTQMKPHPSWYHAPSSVKPTTKLYPLSNAVLTTHYTSMQGLLTPLKPSLSWLKHGVHECLAGMADLFLTPTSVYLSTNLQVWIQFKYCFTSSHVCHQPWTPSPAMRHRGMIQKLTRWQ